MEVTKAITEAFSGAPIPKGAADFRVAALKIDVPTRFMRVRLALSSIPPYATILELKKMLRAHYALQAIEISVTFLPEASTTRYCPAPIVTSGTTHLAGFFALLDSA